LFEKVMTYFEDKSEEVRSAAAFAAGQLTHIRKAAIADVFSGNLAVGSPKVFLPAIIKKIEGAQSESSRVLLLHALKEVSFLIALVGVC
jgi:cullin-associated NEDD8-dissociated protein 1